MHARRDRLWRGYVGASACVGLVAAVSQWGYAGPCAVFAAVVLLTALVWCSLFGEAVGRYVRPALRFGLGLATALVGSAGLVAAFGWSGVIVVAVAAGTSPLVRSRVARRTPGPAPDPPPSPDPELATVLTMPDASPASLDDAALCRAWRRSFSLLQAASRVEDVVALAGRRQQYLDELTRRHPQGVSRWLASGARAAGNPLPFLTEGEQAS